MTGFVFSRRSIERLKGVHPDLVRVITLALTYSRYDFGITEGLRSLERQRELVLKGFSRTMHSKHLRQLDGYAHAVDVVAVGDLNGDGKIDHQDKTLTWEPEIYRSIADAVKLAASDLGVQIRCGVDFRGFFDGPHHELAGVVTPPAVA